jgi:hypothetical protein
LGVLVVVKLGHCFSSGSLIRSSIRTKASARSFRIVCWTRFFGRTRPFHFLDCLRYFNHRFGPESIAEDIASHEILAIPDRKQREAAYALQIGRLRNPVEMMMACRSPILHEFTFAGRSVNR